MNPPPPTPHELITTVLELSLLAACVTTWIRIAARWLHGLPVLPYQPRRPAPWRLFDVILLASVYILTPALVMRAAYSWLGFPRAAVSESQPAAPPSGEHPLSQALLEGHDVWTLLLCLESAVVIAPIAEELLFRLLLQGWLESLERRLRRRIPAMRQIVAGVLPILTVAALFAALHIPGRRQNLPVVILELTAMCISGLVTIAAALFWLRYAAGASLADLGVVPGKLVNDIRLGLTALVAVVVPVYAVKVLLPNIMMADPIAIFVLALPLGILYYRTHRIVPSLALHMAFNALGVFMALGGAK